MLANRNFNECQPLTWIGRHPVYLAGAIACTHALTLVLTALALAAGATGLVSFFRFDSVAATEGFQIWRYVTYAFVYPDASSYLWTALGLYFLAQFGTEVEKFLGRRSFCCLYGLLILAAPILLALLGLASGRLLYSGAGNAHFAVFLAFCIIYPQAELIFGIEARWAGAALFLVNSLMFLATHDMTSLLVFWSASAVAVLWLMVEGVGRFSFPALAERLAERHARRRFSVVRNPAPPRGRKADESIDPILDKIARQGIGSLTRSERESLERARVALLEKERQNS